MTSKKLAQEKAHKRSLCPETESFPPSLARSHAQAASIELIRVFRTVMSELVVYN